MQYVDSVGRFCSKHEAYDNGILKNGYSIRVPMMLSNSGATVSLADAELCSRSDEGGGLMLVAAYQRDICAVGNRHV